MKTKLLIASALLGLILSSCGPKLSKYALSPDPLLYGDCAPAPVLTFHALGPAKNDQLVGGTAFYNLIGAVSTVNGKANLVRGGGFTSDSTDFTGSADISEDLWVFGGMEGEIQYKIRLEGWYGSFKLWEENSDPMSVPVLPCEVTPTPTLTATPTTVPTLTPVPTRKPKDDRPSCSVEPNNPNCKP